MTQIQFAKNNHTTREMQKVARNEGINVNLLKRWIAKGWVVVPSNSNHKNLEPIGIGFGLRTKINTNIGVSPIKSNLGQEVKKLKIAIEAGADTIMDLSITKDADKVRRALIEKCPIPFGTVPIYQAVVEAGKIENLNKEIYLRVLEKHAKDGVDFVTVHAGITRSAFPLIKKRVMKCVSRGGSFLLIWMKYHKKENFLYENFDEILEIAKRYDVTISLGDGLRPGCIRDATDKAQIEELKILGKLAKKAKEAGCQVIIEGPGHTSLNDIEKNIRLEKRYCDNAPFYVLGLLPTDIATGYDHIACAIDGALAGWKGADFLCYVTPREHIGLPNINDVREGTIVTKIAAHIADIAKGDKKALFRDLKMAKARAKVNWKNMQKYVIDQKNLLN